MKIPTNDLEKAFKTHGKNKLGFQSYLVANYSISYKEAKKITEEYLASVPDDNRNFFQRLKDSADIQRQDIVNTQRETQLRIKENKENGVACCPKCGSTSLSASKKGFGIGKAVVGASLTGGIGLVAGNIGAKKVRVTCLNCGHQFMAGKQ